MNWSVEEKVMSLGVYMLASTSRPEHLTKGV